MIKDKNVLGSELQVCSHLPKTGFYRDGSCHTDSQDRVLHTICAVVSDLFLQFSKNEGNDLMTPVPEFDFPGLQEGDCWCLCASRWKEAFENGVAPQVILEATHIKTLEIVDLDILLQYAVDIPLNA
ncbi:MAG: DUF2237 domain-containing protein [Gammaproteobacteria bacterium]|nr:DUF2237 domain-containing protein [Gammaproteobacteria bacterium]